MYFSLEFALLTRVAGDFPDKMSLSILICSGKPATSCSCFTVSRTFGNRVMMSNQRFNATSIFASWVSFHDTASVLLTISLQCSALNTRLRTFAGVPSDSACEISGQGSLFHFCCGTERIGLLQKIFPQIPFSHGISISGLGSNSRQHRSKTSGVKTNSVVSRLSGLWFNKTHVTCCVYAGSTGDADDLQTLWCKDCHKRHNGNHTEARAVWGSLSVADQNQGAQRLVVELDQSTFSEVQWWQVAAMKSNHWESTPARPCQKSCTRRSCIEIPKEPNKCWNDTQAKTAKNPAPTHWPGKGWTSLKCCLPSVH